MNLGAPQSGVDLLGRSPDKGTSHVLLCTSEGLVFPPFGSWAGEGWGEASTLQNGVQSGSGDSSPAWVRKGSWRGGSS